MGPVIITRGTRAPPTQSYAFPVKGAGGAIRARRQEHGHPRPPPCPTSSSPRALWLQLLGPTANRHARHPHPLIYYFLTRSPQFSNPNEAGNEYERKWEATAAQHHPEDLQMPRGRVPPATGHRRDQGAACCFQTLLQPCSSTMAFPAQASTKLLSRQPPPPSALQLWVPAQGAIKGVSPSVPSPLPGPVLGCNPGPEQRAPSHRGHTRWPQGPGGDRDKIPPLYE